MVEPKIYVKDGLHTLGPIRDLFLYPENYYSYKLVQLFESIVMGKDGKHDYYVGIDISFCLRPEIF
jgi:hypothetical protein